jgi:general secretion pathway protein K
MMKRHSRNRGSMLVLVLFLAGLLGVFAIVAAMVMQAAAASSRAFADNLKAEELFRAAIEQTVAQSGGSITNLRGTNIVLLDQAQIAVTLTDESARIDLNNAPLVLLAGLFRQLGVPDDQANIHAARIADWRDEDDQPQRNGGAERAAYRSVGRVDGPRNGAFVHPAELSLVLGIPVRVAAAAVPYLTVASGQEQINPMLADPPVLLAVPGMTVNTVRDLLAQRANPLVSYDTLVRGLGREAEEYFTNDSGVSVRFEGLVRLGVNNERRFEAVVYVAEGDSEPYRILAWDANPPARMRALP